jgi:SAM-dependent methyltransferase
MTAPSRQDHWENVYTTKSEQEVSWYEDNPAISLSLIAESGVGRSGSIVDIGGGASHLVDALVAAGQTHVTVLDLSAAALDVAKARLHGAGNVDWVVHDVTTWSPGRSYDLWHDRAAFHFLTEPEDRHAYVRILKSALKPNGVAIIGTFAPDGPEKCSGLPIARYDADTLAAVLGPEFDLVAHIRHAHTTPWGSIQKFQFSTFRRKSKIPA